MRTYLYSLMTDEKKDPLAKAVKAVLWAASLVYVKLVGWIQAFSPQRRLTKPVISIGNITLGGVGKTPLVALLAEFLKGQGRKPVILTRGYGGRNGQNDEVLLLKEKLPDVRVAVGKDRFAAAQTIPANDPADIFLLDDGFQHWRLRRDLDIVAIDATNPFGNGQVIPRGILREPLSALGRADLLVITKADLAEANLGEIRDRLRDCSSAPVIEAIHQPEFFQDLQSGQRHELGIVRDQPVCLFSGIGDPAGFERTMFSLGARIKQSVRFADHHWYTAPDIERLAALGRQQQVKFLATTAKDAVKLKDQAHLFSQALKVLILQIKMQIREGEDELLERIRNLLRG